MRKYALYFAWVFSLLGVLLSLYSSEVLGMEPCRLCWYQRCALFPLAILLGIATYRNDRNFVPYGLVLASIGAILACIQEFMPVSFCGYDCADKVMVFGFFGIPMVSLIGFGAIFSLLWLSKKAP